MRSYLLQSVAPKRSRRAILVGAFFTALSPLLAQSGRVRIRVTDPTGAAVPEAAISLLDQKKNVARTIKADHAGEAVFAGLPSGTNVFSVALFGFLTQRLIVSVLDGGEVTVQTALQVGETLMGEVIEVKPKRHWWSAK